MFTFLLSDAFSRFQRSHTRAHTQCYANSDVMSMQKSMFIRNIVNKHIVLYFFFFSFRFLTEELHKCKIPTKCS